MLELEAVTSSNVKAIAFKDNAIYVTFHGLKTLYKYTVVAEPKNPKVADISKLWDLLKKAKSKGSFINSFLKINPDVVCEAMYTEKFKIIPAKD